MKNEFSRAAMIIAFAVTLAVPARADLFDQIFSGVNKGKKKVATPTETATKKFKFSVYLTTEDVLKAIEYKGGSTAGRKSTGILRFISNFESDIEVKTTFIKFVDMDNVGDQPLLEEYASAKFDRVYLKNQDYLTGKVVGFGPKEVSLQTTYGDVKASIHQVRYIVFRNPAAISGPAESAHPAGAVDLR